MSGIDFRRYVKCYTITSFKRKKFKKELSKHHGRYRKTFRFSKKTLSGQFGRHYHRMMTYIDQKKCKRIIRQLLNKQYQDFIVPPIFKVNHNDNDSAEMRERKSMALTFINHFYKSDKGQESLKNIDKRIKETLLYGRPLDLYG